MNYKISLFNLLIFSEKRFNTVHLTPVSNISEVISKHRMRDIALKITNMI